MRAAVLVVLLLAPLLPAPAASDACATRDVPGVGRACEVPGGYRVVLDDGASLLTHGPDPVPSHLPTNVGFATPTQPACVGDPLKQYHGHVLYAFPVDRPYDPEVEAFVRNLALEVNGRLREESSRLGRPLDYRMLCDDGGRVRVTPLAVPTISTDGDFDRIVSAARAQGHALKTAAYWIWFDGFDDCDCGGIGSVDEDDHGGPQNANNVGPAYGVTYGWPNYWSAFTMMHENGHNLGAVQNSAPHSSGANHCNDGRDVMCYADGGPRSAYTTTACEVERFDCNNDDYFAVDPAPGSWIATHWNLAMPYNRFLEGCAYLQGDLKLGALGRDEEGVTATTVQVPTACAGHRYHLSGVANQDDFDVCFLGGGAVLRCDAWRGEHAGSVPDGTDAARVVYRIGAGGTFVLSVQ